MEWSLAISLAFGLVRSLIAPPIDSGAFTTTLGRDTIAVERFTRTADLLSGAIVLTTPRVTYVTYRVQVSATGTPTDFRLEQRAVNDTTQPSSIHLVFGSDSIRFTRTQGTAIRYDAAPAESAVYPEILYFWALYELQLNSVMKATTPGDSLAFRVVSNGGAKPYTTTFNRRARDTVSTQWFYPGYWRTYVVDESGRLLGVDATHTTVKVLVARERDFPLDAFLAAAGAHERAAGQAGAMSAADSVTSAIGDVTMSVAYSRPAARGRQIWGGVVPYDSVWRTGANSATRLHLSGPVEIGGTVVPAGTYSLWSVPSIRGAMLIVNKQSGQWGTDYRPERDLARIPLKVDHSATPVERFTIHFEGEGAAERNLVLEWGDVRWTIVVRRPS